MSDEGNRPDPSPDPPHSFGGVINRTSVPVQAVPPPVRSGRPARWQCRRTQPGARSHLGIHGGRAGTARDVALLAVASACSWLLARHLLPSDVDAAVIPTLVLMGRRHFKRGEREAEHEAKHPAVRAVLAAWNKGDFSEAEKYVAPDLVIQMNGFVYDSGPEGDGPAMARESVEYWRAIMPDVKMELSQEIREKDRIAIEWLITGTHTGELPELPASGNLIEIQGSAFLTLEDDKIIKVSTVFDALALAVHTNAAAAPAWWPGHRDAQ